MEAFLCIAASFGILSLGFVAGYYLYVRDLRLSYEKARDELKKTLADIQTVHNQQAKTLIELGDIVGNHSTWIGMMGKK